MNKLLLSIILLSLSTISSAESDWSQANKAIINKFAVPTYETLLQTSEQLVKSSKDFCENIDEKHFDHLKKSFHLSMDAWQIAQILRSGPAMQEMRFYRLEMWPDRSNAASKHLRKLQKEANPESLKAEKFAKASTAIQGLSAMERIIFSEEVNLNDFKTEEKANFTCHLVETISQNIQTISHELLKAWQEDYRKTLSQPSKDNKQFETHKAVTAQFLNDLNTQLQVVLTQKFKRPLGHNHFRLTRAESWRSQRSLHNILLNITASKRLYNIGFSSYISDKKLLKKQQELFDKAIKEGKALALPLAVAHKDHLEKLQQWIQSITALKMTINSDLPIAIDIPLGFNSLDGD